jgi:hypothetical protein
MSQCREFQPRRQDSCFRQFGQDGDFVELDLDDLLVRGCNWVRDYLQTNPNVSESDRSLCDGVK